MADQVLMFLGYGLATIAMITAYVMGQKSKSLQNAMAGQAANQNLAQKTEKALRHELAEAMERDQQKASKLTKLEKDNRALQERLRSTQQDGDKITAEWESKIASLQNKIEHYQEEAKALTAQITELDQEKREIRKDLSSKETQAGEKFKKSLDESQEKTKELKAKIRELEKIVAKSDSEVSRLKEQKQENHAAENLQLKRKIHQYHYFYKTMRLQKEMVEERNANWEKALILLASAIYQDKAKGKTVPTNLGELIGGALTLAKQPQLVIDDAPLVAQAPADISPETITQ